MFMLKISKFTEYSMDFKTVCFPPLCYKHQPEVEVSSKF